MDDEIWRDVRGYEGKYQVSNMGRVKSLNYRRTGKEQILRPRDNRKGYLFVVLCKCGKTKVYTIHRLVLSTFSPCTNSESLQVNHINEKRDDNRLKNLEWCTASYNLTYNDRHKRAGEKNTNGKKSLPIAQLSLEGKYIRSWKSSRDAERECGFTHSTIIRCCKGIYKTHKGYRFMYLSEFLDKNNGLLID